MLTAVWVAVIVALAFWVIGVCVAVYVLMKSARLISDSAAAVTALRERGDALIDRANAAVDRTSEQLARTEAITASMDDVTANMAELSGRMAALAPLARLIAGSAGSPVARAAALVYGVRRALDARRAGRSAVAGKVTTRALSRAAVPAEPPRALTSEQDGASQ